MFKTIKNLFVVALIGSLFSSCINNDDNGNQELVTQQSFSSYVAFVNSNSGDRAVLTGIGLTLYLDYTNMKSWVDVTGLKVGGNSYPTITLKGLTWKQEKSGIVTLAGSTLTAESSGLAIPTIGNLSGTLVERLIELLVSGTNQSGYWPNLALRFEMANQYEIVISSPMQIFEGTLKSESREGATFSTTTPVYTATIDVEKGVMAIRMNNVQFVQGMPAMNIDIPAIPFTQNRFDLAFSAESIVPTIADTPYPPYTLSNIHGNVDFTKGLKLQFECTPPNMSTFTVDIDAPFDYQPQTN